MEQNLEHKKCFRGVFFNRHPNKGNKENIKVDLGIIWWALVVPMTLFESDQKCLAISYTVLL